ncbi:MAG: ATP-binding protein [Bacteroidia bacterium]
MIVRSLFQEVNKRMFSGKIILLIGPRQVGKTTLMQQLQQASNQNSIWLNCDEPDIRKQLEGANSTQLANLIGSSNLVFIDEAQRVNNIGITLKLLADNFKSVQVIATGSSAFELSNELNEPLTGRKWEYQMFPLTAAEMREHHGQLAESRNLHQRLIFGAYPDVVQNPADAAEILLELSQNYLYKDVLGHEALRKPLVLEKLLQALALQLSNEVSFNELGQLIGIEHRTVEKYIQLLEKCFIVFSLPAFSRNLRNEIKKSRKIYFYDNGVRNAILKNFNPVDLRTDIGALWENYLISERKKWLSYSRYWVNSYFWRTHNQQEIDLIEEHAGKLHAYEFKWNVRKKAQLPSNFAKAYPNSNFELLHPENYLDFIGA